MLPMRSPKDFAEQSVASALRALGVEGKEAVRIATMELPVPEPLERGRRLAAACRCIIAKLGI